MSVFQFKYFSVKQSDSAMKVGTDAMLLGSFIDCKGKSNGLDIGTGTGVLSLMLVQRNPDLFIDAVELDKDTFREAEHNFKNSDWHERLNAIHSDFLLLENEKLYDLVISNPPYYCTQLPPKDERTSKAKHTSSLPLASLLNKVQEMLTLNGEFWIIIPFHDHEKWIKEAGSFGLIPAISNHLIGKRGDIPVRTILCFCKSESPLVETEFVIREADSKYTIEYRELTKEFHSRSVIR